MKEVKVLEVYYKNKNNNKLHAINNILNKNTQC